MAEGTAGPRALRIPPRLDAGPVPAAAAGPSACPLQAHGPRRQGPHPQVQEGGGEGAEPGFRVTRPVSGECGPGAQALGSTAHCLGLAPGFPKVRSVEPWPCG